MTPDDYFAQALLCEQQGQTAEAVDAYISAGLQWHATGNLPLAGQAYTRSLNLNPTQAGIWSNLGLIYQQLQQSPEALTCYQRALQLEPDLPDGWNNLGTLQQAQGNLEQAAIAYHQCLRCQSNYWQSHLNLGVIYQHIQQHQQAFEHYQQALALNPAEAMIYRKMGYLLYQQQQWDEALACYQQGLQQAGQDPDLLYHLAQTLKYHDQPQQAQVYYEQLWQVQPTQAWRRLQSQLYCPPWFKSQTEQQQWEQRLTVLLAQTPPLKLADHLAEFDEHKVETLGRLVYHGNNVRPLKEAYTHCFIAPTKEPRTSPVEGPIKLGFLVTAGHHQIFLHFCQGLIEHLSPSDFTITLICAADQQPWLAQHLHREELNWLVLPLTFAAMIPAIAQAQLDILYFWEVGTDQFNTFLPYFRLARVQCTSWGSVATTGNDAIDYFISSTHIESPNAQEHYSEKLVCLSHLPACYQPPPQPPQYSRTQFDLPEHDPLYVCPQNLFKFHPDFDAALAALLTALPESHLLVFEGFHTDWGKQLRQRWQQVMSDAFKRIIFLPRLDYLNYLSVLTLCQGMLDPFYFGGCQTSYEALGLGVPIVTLPGASARSQFTAGMYRQMGWTELVAQDASGYLNLAIKLGTELDWNRECRERILSHKDALFHDQTAVNELADEFKGWFAA